MHARSRSRPASARSAWRCTRSAFSRDRRLVDDVERHRDDAELIVLPSPCPLRITPIDFRHADELIDRR
jgi:hypothetical protein